MGDGARAVDSRDEIEVIEDSGDLDTAGDDTDPIRNVLRELDVQGSVASIDMRVVEVEQQLRSLADRVDLATRQQVGELDVMRARISDVITLIRDAASGREDAVLQLDGDIAELLDGRFNDLMQHLHEIREGSASQTQAALARLDDVVATLRGESNAAADDTARQLAAVTDRIDELAGAVAASEAGITAAVEGEATARRDELEDLEKRLNGRLDVGAEAASEARRRLDERIESFRRELDASSGELRAHVAVALGDITSRLDDVDSRLASATVTDGDSGGWRQLGDELMTRSEALENALRQAIEEEAAARIGAVEELADQVADALRLAREAAEQRPGDDGEIAADPDKVLASIQAISRRVSTLQSTLAHAVNDVASGLSNRVATLAGQVDGMRDTLGRTQERLGAWERLEARLVAIEKAQADRTAETDLAQQVTDLQRELSRVAGRLDSFARQATAADERAEALRRDVGVLGDEIATAGAWRSELRDLTTRTSELAGRVAEVETIARRAGNAVVEAVRQIRGDVPVGD